MAPRKDLNSLIKELSGPVLRKAAFRTLNKAATSVRSEMSKRIRQTVRLKAKDVKEALVVERAKAGSLATMSSKIIIKAKGVPLYQFDAKVRSVKTEAGTRVGATVNVTGARKTVRGAFITKLRSGKVGVFMRGRKGSAYSPKGKRLPIRMLFSTSVAQVVSGKEFQEGILDFARERVRVILSQELNYEFSKLGKS